MKPEKIIYTGRASAFGGRTGTVKSDDGALNIALTTPKELGGDGEFGINPEQMFAAGYAACFIGALKFVGVKQKITLPQEMEVMGEVGIGPIPAGFNIAVVLNISLPGLDKEFAEDLIKQAHQVCPYSNATRNNIEVTLNLI